MAADGEKLDFRDNIYRLALETPARRGGSSSDASRRAHACSARYAHTFWHDLPLVPGRDTLLALPWLDAAFGSHVVWRGARMPVANRVTPPRTSIAEISDRG